ncbi:MAG TPA: hypothetical protein DCP28_08035, partial [Cytophagales bacterium]|nr:hypothetical protein [Cytophagales bacterium]
MAEQSNQPLFSEFSSPTKQDWIDRAVKDLKGADFDRKLLWNFEENIKIRPFYVQEDLDALTQVGRQQNLTTNVDTTPLAAREWETREYLKVDNPTVTNKLALEALNQGATGLLFDLTELGMADLNVLLKDIMPAYCSISFRTGNSAYAIIKKYKAWLIEQGTDLNQVTGQLGFDPVSRWMVHGELDNSCFHQIFDVLETAQDLPNFKAFVVSGKPIKNAGGSLSQEIGMVLALTVGYLDELTRQGLSPALAFRHLSVETAVGTSYFPEVAKYRALRYLIARLAEVYGVQDFLPQHVYLSAQSALWNKTIFDPYVNMLRNTTEAMAAVLGGVNALTILPHDQTFRRSDGFSRRIARNISNLLQNESHLDAVADPSAGSYYLEHLTQQLIEQGWAFFQEIESHGGVKGAFKAGWIQSQVQEVREKTEKKILSRKQKLVGVNDYPNAREKMDPEAIEPPVTVEATDTEYSLFPMYRAAAPFEALRLDTEREVKRHGNDRRPRVLPVLIGDPVMRKARASFSAGFFGVAGFHILPEQVHQGWNDAALAALDSEANIVVLC